MNETTRKAPTIRDVAASCGVSISTVSRVVNGREWVSPETKERVQKAVNDLGFQPRGFAQNMRRPNPSTNSYGILLASPSPQIYHDDLFMSILHGVGDIAEEESKSLLVARVPQHYRTVDDLPAIIRNKLVDGLIVGGIPISDRTIRDLAAIGLPLVVIGRYPAYSRYSVLVDNYGGTRAATEHLIERGHRSIACVSGPYDIYSFQDKVDGYRAALSKHGIAIRPDLFVEEEISGDPVEAGYIAAEELWARQTDATALLVLDSQMRIGVFNSLSSRNVIIPDDLAIVGYDTQAATSNEGGFLTNVSVSGLSIGHAAARLLSDVIRGRVGERLSITVSTDLVLGRSTLGASAGSAR